jgi:hypothetical protein
MTLAVIALVATNGAAVTAQRRATSTRSRATRTTTAPRSTRPVQVRSYTTKSGQTVAAHTRAAPGTATKRAAAPKPAQAGAPRRTTLTPRASARAKAPTRSTTAPARTSTVARSSDGRIARSAQAKSSFMRQTGFPKGRPGYVVDHIIPLACGGPDVPSNMQWQTVAAGKAKDKTERKGCR